MKFMAAIILLMKFDIYPLWIKMCQLITWYKDLKFKDYRGNIERSITFISLDYKH